MCAIFREENLYLITCYKRDENDYRSIFAMYVIHQVDDDNCTIREEKERE